jgi:AcrR family transcriptional regulator
VSRNAEIVDCAERLLEREGPSAVTMRRLASELGIQAPSLYKHVKGKDDIVVALQVRALEGQAAALSHCEDLASLAAAYRGWALEHPRLYQLVSRYPLDRKRLPAGVEDAAAAPLMKVAGYDQHLARTLWAAAHGLVDLELAGRFPPDADLDAAWVTLVRSFT